jgi:hypothetical protein
MKSTTRNILKAGLVICIAALFVGTSTAASTYAPEKIFTNITKKVTTPSDPNRDQVELKYYDENNLDTIIGLSGGTYPTKWKSAIRLTQDELGPYSDWTMTQVNVWASFDEYPDGLDVQIYLYDKGTTPIRPGALINSDTTAHLDVTGGTIIPLVTPVDLAGHEEIWVAVEWNQPVDAIHYAWLDTLSGPHVENKSDFIYLGGWQQLHDPLPTADGRWGIGAIVEGSGLAELSIGNIAGPIGIKADVSNIGANDANNIEWSIAVTGGILKKVDASATGTAATLAAGSSLPASLGAFLGFGKISIVVTANAQNALETSVTKSAFLLGPFVLSIK